jgi:hypothetical protein
MSLFSEGDVADFRASRLALVQNTYFPSVNLSDAYILGQIQAAEQDAQTQLKVFFEPTFIFPYDPSDAEIAALAGNPWSQEPGYDYDPQFFQNERWGYILARQHPIISITSIQFVYPSPQNLVYAIPNDWLRVDKKYGHIRMVPASSTFVAPLGAFLMQALGGGSSIPSMIQMKYTAGLTNAKTTWPLLIDVIYKMALLRIIQETFTPNSGSISADGLSQSMGIKMQDWQDQIDRALFGPKGANGGLWTALNGIQSGVIGVV